MIPCELQHQRKLPLQIAALEERLAAETKLRKDAEKLIGVRNGSQKSGPATSPGDNLLLSVESTERGRTQTLEKCETSKFCRSFEAWPRRTREGWFRSKVVEAFETFGSGGVR